MPVVLQGLDPRVLAALRKIQEQAQARGIQTNLLSAYRTKQDQQELYDNWQAGQRGLPLPHPGRGAVPRAALPGTSPHEKGFAFDLQAVDPSRQSELWSLGPAAGVRALGIRDPAHFEFADAQGAGGLVSTPSNPPPSGGAGPSRFLLALQSFESGDRSHPEKGGSNIANTHQGTSSGQAQGYNQITTGTWGEFGGTKYAANPLLATEAQQNEIASQIPLKRWAPETLDYLKAQGFQIDPNKTLGENVALNGGNTGSGGGSASAAASPASGDWQNLLGAEAPQDPGDLGSLLSSAVSTAAPSSPRQPQAPVQTQPAEPPVDFSFAPIADTSEALGARYVQNKKARELSTLGDLFTIKTIGQPGGPKTPAQLAPGSSNRIIG